MTISKSFRFWLLSLLFWQSLWLPALSQTHLAPPPLPDLPQPQLTITQQSSEAQPLIQPGPDYLLDSDDQLSLLLWNRHINLSYELQVNAQGEIFVPRLGSLKAQGLTLSALQQALQQKLSRLQASPQEPIQADLFLKQARRIQILISGRVNRPGQYQLPWGSSLLEALRRAGGVAQGGSVRQLQLNGTELDLLRFYEHGERQVNPALRGGEHIHVPPLRQRVALLGEVQQPGMYEILPGETVQQLLRWAGGTKASALPGQIQHWPAGLNQRDSSQLMPIALESVLSAGDIVQIPARQLEAVQPQVFIRGQVRQAGAINWHEALRLLDVLQQAGGELNNADLGAVLISRRQADGGREELRVNLQAFLNGQAHDGNPFLQPGDAILVPESFFNVRNITEWTTLIVSTLGIVSVVINLSSGWR